MCVEECGNSLISETEQCEDGNTDDFDGCSSECQKESGWTHTTTKVDGLDVTVATPICGDGVIVGPELCDDRFLHCQPGCMESIPDWTCSLMDDVPTITICKPTCGDGVLI